MKKQAITDMDLQAFIDNEVSSEDRARILSALEQDEQMRKRYEMFLHQRSLVQFWWAQGAREH